MKLKETFYEALLKRYNKVEKKIIKKMERGETKITFLPNEWEEIFLKWVSANLDDFNFKVTDYFFSGCFCEGYKVSWTLKEDK